jgi:hypothetical protein
MSKAFYEDPFFNDDEFNHFGNYIFEEFNNDMQEMRNNFNSIFQTKPAIDQSISDANGFNSQIPQQNYVYNSNFSSYSDSNGMTHTKYKVSDNIHGTKIAETRRIGDQAITWKRIINKEGRIEDKETLHNIKEKDKFTQEWDERFDKCFAGNRSIDHPDHAAIQ